MNLYIKRIQLFGLILTLVPVWGMAQNIQIIGVVVSENDSTTLEFSHVFIKNSTIGTYTNLNGQFVLNFADSLSSDTLVVSRVGYISSYLPLSKSISSDTLKISLQESNNILDEIVVYAGKDTASAIVKKAIKNFRKNYPLKLHYLEGFYRELSFTGGTYTRLIEASLGITESSYRNAQTKSKIKIRQIRKSEDYREYSLKKKLYVEAMKKMTELVWGKTYLHYNNVHRLLLMNLARSNYTVNGERKKVNNFLEKYEFEIDKVTMDDSVLFYHISFREPPESSSEVWYTGGNMTINMDNYAITEWKWGTIPHPNQSQSDDLLQDGKFFRQQHILYSKLEDKYYPTYYELIEPTLDGTTTHLNEKTGKKEYQYNKITLMINEVVTRKKDFDRIKKREAIEEGLDLYDIDHPYNSDFWSSYNILLIDPLLRPAIEDLEEKKSLEKQFEENGK